MFKEGTPRFRIFLQWLSIVVIVILLFSCGRLYHTNSMRMEQNIILKNKRILKALSFPHASAVREDVLDAPWVNRLRTLLLEFRSNEVILVVSNNKFQTVLLNWLIASLIKCKPPLKNVLVIALEKELHLMLKHRKIPSVFVSYKSVVNPKAKMRTNSSKIWITRNAVYRLVNHWGYDVAVFDLDAIVVRNPQGLFDAHQDSDIIGSSGTYPFDLGRKWGFTFCMGMAVFRHTTKTELFWEALSKASVPGTLDDQVKMNNALDNCNIQWSEGSIAAEDITGHCHGGELDGLRVDIISRKNVCRERRLDNPQCESSYIMHAKSGRWSEAKMAVAKTHNEWFLRDNWAKISNETTLTGLKWLQAISI